MLASYKERLKETETHCTVGCRGWNLETQHITGPKLSKGEVKQSAGDSKRF